MNASLPETPAPYAPPQFGAGIRFDLSRNEGRAPHQAPQVGAAGVERYPDLEGLREAMADYCGVDASRVLVTAGGDDALLRCCLASLGPGREALLATPTFEMIPRYAKLAGGTLREVAWPEGPFPVEAMLAAAGPAVAVVFVVSPNNPTGAVARAADVVRITRALPGALVVVDAAYEEFADAPLTAAVVDLPNVVVVRTLSKAVSLAGLRVGCAIAAPALLQRLAAAGNPMPVSVASATLATARLRHDRADIEAHVEAVRAQRPQLAARLQRYGLRPATPQQGNFVLVRGCDAARLTASLASLGVAVRRFPDDPALADAVRITLPGTDDGMRALQRALDVTFAPEALLFDMDGVLADVRGSYRVAIVDTARSFGAEVTAADVAAAKARGGCNDDWQLTQRLMAERGVERPLDEVTARFEQRYRELECTEQLMVDAERLWGWRERFRLAVVTGRPRVDAERFLDRFGLRAAFDAVICREHAPLKPDPAPVRLALQQLGVGRAWMLGDTVDDANAASAAGVLPLGIDAAGAVPGAAFTLASPNLLDQLLP